MHNLCSHWEVLEIRNGALYLRYENEDGTTSEPLLVVPRCLVNDVLTFLLANTEKRRKNVKSDIVILVVQVMVLLLVTPTLNSL